MPDQAIISFSTFGEMLKHLRRRARLTQKELGIAVGYSEAHVARLESGQRIPDLATVQALLVQALDLKNETALAAELVRLAKLAHGEKPEPEPHTSADTASKCPNNLPVQLSGFIGREHEIQDVLHLLTTTRLLTLTGSGGAGKTRLSIEIGNALVQPAATFPDGVWLVELAPISDSKLVPDAVLAALKLAEAKRNATDELVDYLRDMQLLITLDNCEHLIRACAELAEALLRGCPNLRILATSREGLNIPGEVTHRVPPMASDEAIQLFTERARAAHPTFSVTAHNQLYIAEICQRLDGMPLALELAAARLRIMSVEQIAARLDDRFHLLTGGTRTALPRQQTLRTLIDWSYDLLPLEERGLLQQLSVFAGGCTLEAVEAVCGSPETIDLLDQLVNKSLANAVDTPTGTRYQLLETIRQYAHEKLVEAGEFEAAQGRHLSYFTALTQRAAAQINSSERRYWLDVLEADHDNLRAALGWAAHAEDGQAGAELAIALCGFWKSRGFMREGLAWLDALVLQSDSIRPSYKGRAVVQYALMSISIGEMGAGVQRIEQMLPLLQQMNDDALVHSVGLWLVAHPGPHSTISLRDILRREIDWARTHASPYLPLDITLVIHALLQRTDEYALAEEIVTEGMAICAGSGDSNGVAQMLLLRADTELSRGNYAEARDHLELAIVHSRAADEIMPLADGLVELATVTLRLRDEACVSSSVKEALQLYQHVRNAERIAQCICLAAGLAHLRGQHDRAVRLLAVTMEQHEHKITSFLSFYPEYDLRFAALLNDMNPADFDRAWAAGRQMKIKDAIAEVLSM